MCPQVSRLLRTTNHQQGPVHGLCLDQVLTRTSTTELKPAGEQVVGQGSPQNKSRIKTNTITPGSLTDRDQSPGSGSPPTEPSAEPASVVANNTHIKQSAVMMVNAERTD